MANTEQAVLEAANPQEALLAIARALDALIEQAAQPPANAWDEIAWQQPERQMGYVEPARRRAEITTDGIEGGIADVNIPAPLTEERKEQRRQFERQQLRLAENLGDSEDWTEAYALGGPRWLYYGNRELFMTYPEQTRAAMIADVIEDDPDEAHEIGRDALKHRGEQGPGSTGMRVDDEVAPARAE